jgi:chemotaxis regulatin CheY-phosphate phosphatase CheZ
VELVGQEMAEPRKVFRIEQTAAARLRRGVGVAPAELHHDATVQALYALRATMAAPSRPAANLQREDTERLGVEAAQLGRIAHELDAVLSGTAQATQRVLAAAEEIDQLANNLSAALKGKIEQGPAQDIRDLVIRIFEACNFQDLTGQRVTKVMATLKCIEDHIAHAVEDMKNAPHAPALDDAAQYLHGPRLDIDSGHLSQAEIDAMFGG